MNKLDNIYQIKEEREQIEAMSKLMNEYIASGNYTNSYRLMNKIECDKLYMQSVFSVLVVTNRAKDRPHIQFARMRLVNYIRENGYLKDRKSIKWLNNLARDE